MDAQPTLAPHYYLDNFIKLTSHAQQWYSDLLHEDEQVWLARFNTQSRDAQCLLVRLLSRKGEWFRSDKLHYPEIGSITEALSTLEQHGFIRINGPIDKQTLAASLLTKPEIVALFSPLNKQQKKETLVAELPREPFLTPSALDFDWIKLEQGSMLDLLLTLFFANTHQDLSQFVLDDLGLHRYEPYPLSRERRFFPTRDDVDSLLQFSQLSEQYQQGDRKCADTLVTLAVQTPTSLTHPYVERKRQHLINDIARDLERVQRLEESLTLYQQTELPPTRERQARILDKLDRDFSDVVTRMLHAPRDQAEYEVALKLQQRLKRKQGERVPRAQKPAHDAMHVALDLSRERVELAVKAHLEAQGWQVYFCENALLNGLFGLAFWPVIFAPVEGAFINAYQYRPLDLYHSDFASKRREEIEQVMQTLQGRDWSALLTTYRDKYATNNAFVQWSLLDETLLSLALNTIPTPTLIALFRILLSDLKLYRNGQPDLIAFKEGQYRWIEVKGPGDKLQDNQWRWIEHFTRLEVPFSVCYVTHQTEPNSSENAH